MIKFQRLTVNKKIARAMFPFSHGVDFIVPPKRELADFFRPIFSRFFLKKKRGKKIAS